MRPSIKQPPTPAVTAGQIAQLAVKYCAIHDIPMEPTEAWDVNKREYVKGDVCPECEKSKGIYTPKLVQ